MCHGSTKLSANFIRQLSRELRSLRVTVPSCYSDIELVCVDILYCNAKCRLVGALIFGSSDHSRVDFTAVLELALTNNIPDASTKQSKCYQWRDGDYEGIGDFLASYDWDQLFCLNPTVNEMWLAFSDVMYSAIDIYVPSPLLAVEHIVDPVNVTILNKKAQLTQRERETAAHV